MAEGDKGTGAIRAGGIAGNIAPGGVQSGQRMEGVLPISPGYNNLEDEVTAIITKGSGHPLWGTEEGLFFVERWRAQKEGRLEAYEKALAEYKSNQEARKGKGA